VLLNCKADQEGNKLVFLYEWRGHD